MFCHKCGKAVEENKGFCVGCGAKLEAVKIVRKPMINDAPISKKSGLKRVFRSDYREISGKVSVLRGLVAAVLIILITVSAFAGSALWMARSVSTPENVYEVLDEVKVSEIPIMTDENGEKIVLVDFIGELMRELEIEVTNQEIAEMLDEGPMRDVTSQAVLVISKYIYEGEDVIKEEVESFETYLREEGDPTLYIEGLEMTEAEFYSMIADEMERNDIVQQISLYGIEEYIGGHDTWENVRAILSEEVMMILLAASLVLLLLLYFVNRRALIKTLMNIGVIMLVMSVLYFASYIALENIDSLLFDDNMAGGYVFAVLRDAVTDKLLIMGGVLLSGLVLIIPSAVIRRKLKKIVE